MQVLILVGAVLASLAAALVGAAGILTLFLHLMFRSRTR